MDDRDNVTPIRRSRPPVHPALYAELKRRLMDEQAGGPPLTPPIFAQIGAAHGVDVRTVAATLRELIADCEAHAVELRVYANRREREGVA